MTTETLSTYKKWMVTLTVMLVAIIEVIDMTIVVVALPHMMGSLSASPEQITWVISAYIVSAAIVMLLTGFLSKRLGTKRLLLISVTGFMLSSLLCGLATNLSMMVLFRVLQGIFGASLIPLSQAIIIKTFPIEERGPALAVWGIGIMAGPVIGPTLGGFITELASWRWVFYINIPFCIISLFLTSKLITETPIIKNLKIDWIGLCLMIIGIGSLQLCIDQGNQFDWFHSTVIIVLSASAFIALMLFVYHVLHTDNPIINLRLLKNRNLSICTPTLMFLFSGFFATISLQPILLETLMHYSATTTGLVLAPRGLMSAVGMAIISLIIGRYDTRAFMVGGLLISGTSTLVLAHFPLNTAFWQIATVNGLQGLGMGLVFIPLSSAALSTIAAEETIEAAGIYSFARSLGASLGVSIYSTILTRETQINWNHLGGHLHASNPTLQHWFQVKHFSLQNPQTYEFLRKIVQEQARMVSFEDIFYLAALSFFIFIPLLYFIHSPTHKPKRLQ
jgi:DHA2 family multidrug resistance protein